MFIIEPSASKRVLGSLWTLTHIYWLNEYKMKKMIKYTFVIAYSLWYCLLLLKVLCRWRSSLYIQSNNKQMAILCTFDFLLSASVMVRLLGLPPCLRHCTHPLRLTELRLPHNSLCWTCGKPLVTSEEAQPPLSLWYLCEDACIKFFPPPSLTRSSYCSDYCS